MGGCGELLAPMLRKTYLAIDTAKVIAPSSSLILGLGSGSIPTCYGLQRYSRADDERKRVRCW